MKKIWVLILCALSLWSCTSDNASLTDNDIQEGKWVVSLYIDRGVDITSYFSGYLFEFKEASVVNATKDNVVIKGTWARTTDEGKNKLTLQFSNPDSFADLNEDWIVVKEDATAIELMHESKEGHIAQLILQAKN
ncbi:MAG: hypothetical protein IPN29_16925 [Saprospiraceae bacterium]|nr:hypothetical protein [Saprospiraceae bacterium]